MRKLIFSVVVSALVYATVLVVNAFVNAIP